MKGLSSQTFPDLHFRKITQASGWGNAFENHRSRGTETNGQGVQEFRQERMVTHDKVLLLKIERDVYIQQVFTGQNQHADSPVLFFVH